MSISAEYTLEIITYLCYNKYVYMIGRNNKEGVS